MQGFADLGHSRCVSGAQKKMKDYVAEPFAWCLALNLIPLFGPRFCSFWVFSRRMSGAASWGSRHSLKNVTAGGVLLQLYNILH